MNSVTPTRRALGDLPVNTFGTPSLMSSMGKEAAGQKKRRIQEVEEPQYPTDVSRVCISPSRSPIALANEIAEDVDERGSPNSCKDSVSSVADFDPDETMASQQTAATEVTQPLQSRARQHAQTLRLRLRLAHFKVRTNQTTIPLSRLRISTHDPPDGLPSPETTDFDKQPPLPKLLPAPVLIPTAYSARTIPQPQIPSSPPSSIYPSPVKASEEVFRTPALPRHSEIGQIGSPPSSQQQSPRKMLREEDDLTSSAVRGKAAIGLMGLRQER